MKLNQKNQKTTFLVKYNFTAPQRFSYRSQMQEKISPPYLSLT